MTGKTINYSLTPLDLRVAITTPLAALEKALAALATKLDLPLDDLRQAAAELLAPAGTVVAPSPEAEAERLAVEEMLQAMRDINPRVDTGDVVSIPELRSRLAFRFDKAEFDRCLLDLAEQWRVTLHFFNQAAALSESERLPLVEDEQGQCYNVVSLRRST